MNEIDKLFETYPKSFTSQGTIPIRLKILVKSETKIDYRHLPYKILFPNSTFYIINILEKYGTIFSLMESLVTRKMSVDNANADQISFIVNSMHGYSDEKLYGTKKVKSKFFITLP